MTPHPLLYTSIAVVLALHSEVRAQDVTLDELLQQHVKLGRDSAALLAQVTSRQSATQATPALRALIERFAVIGRTMNAHAALSDAEAQPLRQKYERPLRESWGKVYHEIYRIQKAQSYGSAEFVQTFQLFCKLLDQ